ncbi:MAG: outer membrane lipoprotein carrier protein LolA [Alistipes sp.]|nr:outer membrane lipoprotein carrier protein LolA [Alistipes sp.]
MAQSQESIIRQIEQVGSATKSVECSFVQTKHVKLLNDKMVSYGKMYYSAPSLLRWEYTSPYTYTFILNQHQVLLKSAQRQDVVDVNNSKMFKEIVRLMMSSVVGSCLSDDTTFDVSIASVGNEWVATLLPLRRDMKQMWSRLVVHFNRSNQSVVKVEMYEPSGDYTIIELSNIRRNATIDSKLFSIN